MKRPCTLWGETFDAMDVKAVNDYLTFGEESAMPSMGYNCGVLIRDPFKGDIASPTYKKKRESYKAIIEAITTIAEALNAPVLVTEEVLDAMWKSAGHCSVIFDVGGVYNSPSGKRAYNRHELRAVNLEAEGGSKYFRYVRDNRLQCGYKLEIGDYIQADCPLGLQLLLQFTLDGVRIKGGG